jgi:hypothetical protein
MKKRKRQRLLRRNPGGKRRGRMELSERFGWMLLGMGVGFVLGYIVARLREIKEEVEEIDAIVKEVRKRDEGGYMHIPKVANALYLLVLAIVVWGAFSAQKASNEVESAQDRIAQVTACNQEYLADIIETVNERTTYTAEQARLNIELQQSQSQFLGILLEDPPPSDQRRSEALRSYFGALGDFIEINARARDKAAANPYPTRQEYQSCVNEGVDNE